MKPPFYRFPPPPPLKDAGGASDPLPQETGTSTPSPNRPVRATPSPKRMLSAHAHHQWTLGAHQAPSPNRPVRAPPSPTDRYEQPLPPKGCWERMRNISGRWGRIKLFHFNRNRNGHKVVNLYLIQKIIFLGISFKITERKSGTY